MSYLWFIKIILSLGLITGAYFYWEHLVSFQQKYKDEQKLHQAAANSLLAERLAYKEIHEDAKKLEGDLNEIAKQNSKYRACVANRTCYVSLREQETKAGGLQTANSTPTPSVNGTSGGIEFSVQQDIFDLEASIRKDELIINGLQHHINKYCSNSIEQIPE